MLLMRRASITLIVIATLATLCCARCHAQAALLLEEPYGFFGVINPTGHTAIYFEHICADTPVKLRRCGPDESGSVISRYQGINDYDWVAIPLVPYLYSVEDASEVPARVNREMVRKMRDRYREAHLQSLGEKVFTGNLVHGGWTQLIGTAYERRIYAFRFNTTAEQDDALIEAMNEGPNRSRFNLLYNNCADFARRILNSYFPRTFSRSIFPDAGMTTPKQITYKLARYGHKHPDSQLTLFEIPQVPGYRRQSHANKSIAESLTTTGYAVPIVLINPYVAGGIFADYLARGRFHLILKNPLILSPDSLSLLTAPAVATENPVSAGAQAPGAAALDADENQPPPAAKSGLVEIKGPHE
jgi:hypothetical protein